LKRTRERKEAESEISTTKNQIKKIKTKANQQIRKKTTVFPEIILQ